MWKERKKEREYFVLVLAYSLLFTVMLGSVVLRYLKRYLTLVREELAQPQLWLSSSRVASY